jgi:hypothetical protein
MGTPTTPAINVQEHPSQVLVVNGQEGEYSPFQEEGTGNIFWVESSYVELEVGPVWSPYGNGEAVFINENKGLHDHLTVIGRVLGYTDTVIRQYESMSEASARKFFSDELLSETGAKASELIVDAVLISAGQKPKMVL